MTCFVGTSSRLPFDANICRLCIQTDETLWNIFEACDEDTNLNLPEKIFTCLNIMVDINDGLSDLVCGKCMTVVQCFYDYRQDCIQNDKILKESLQSLCNLNSKKSIAVVGRILQEGSEEVDNGSTDEKPLESTSVNDIECSISKTAPDKESHVSLNDTKAFMAIGAGIDIDAPIVLQLKEDWSEDEEPTSCMEPSLKEKESPWRLTELELQDGDSLDANCSNTMKDTAEAYVSQDMYAGKISRKESGVWVCNLCSQEYKILRNMKKHISRHYAGISKQCLECQISFKSVEELESHKSQHIASSFVLGHTCEVCNKTFQLNHLLKKHIDFEHNTADGRVSGPTKFRVTCGKCVREFYCSAEMENHNESCGESLDGNGSEDDSSEENSKTKKSHLKYKQRFWPCYLCNLVFENVPQLTFHFKKDHDGHKPLKCDRGCEKFFERLTQLTEHRKRVHGPGFPCDICKHVFKEKSKYKDHMAIHEGVKAYPCDICGENFRTSRDVIRHKRHHFKPLKCDHCGKRIATKYDLNRHRAQVHSVGEDFICDVCGKVCAHSSNLRHHKQVHHTKTFKCKLCDKEMTSSAAQFMQHGRSCSARIRNTCKLCNRQFKRKSDINYHMKRAHMIE